MSAPAQPGAFAPDDPGAARRGILFVLIAMAAISVNDMVIKFLSGDYPLHQMVFLRSLISLPFTFTFLYFEGGLTLLRTKTPGLHALRALLIVFANMSYFAALVVLPLAEATAIFYIAPLFVTVLSVPILGEIVGVRRLAAVIVGLVGVVVMLPLGQGDRGGLDAPLWALALPVAAAAAYAGMHVLTRKLGISTRASAMAIYVQSAFLCVSALFFLVAGDGRFAEGVTNPSLQFLLRPWIWPTAQDWPLFILIGCMGGAIGFCLSQAYRLGPPATIASYEYIALPLAIFWGWVVFGDVPGVQTGLGILLIVGAGIYVFFREAKRDAPVAARQPQRRL
ncbi:MAG: DMT family transporter [Pseudomonadota bacterium]